MRGNTSYFSHARTAMKYGVKLLSINKGDKILIPDFICDVVFHPLDDLQIEYEFYSLYDDLTPKWDALEKLVTIDTKAIMMIHYFGQPQDVKAFMSFCNKHKLYLIEDNAHGYGGMLNGKLLGTFGDIGFSSPRKHLLTSSGGVLYQQGVVVSPPENLPDFPVLKLKKLFLSHLRRFPYLKASLRRLLKKEPDYSNPLDFPEIKVKDYCIDDDSLYKIEQEEWGKHAVFRREAWIKLSKYAIDNGLIPLWSEPHPESSPWVFPVYSPNKQKRIDWLHDGWVKGYDVFPWPTLHKKVIQSSPVSIKRWEKLFCFHLQNIPKKIRNKSVCST